MSQASKVDSNPLPLKTLADIIFDMTGDERKEKLLAAYCKKQVEEWDTLTKNDSRLQHYISPWFSRPRNRKEQLLDSSEQRDVEDHFVPLTSPYAMESEKFARLFAVDSEDGEGKPHPLKSRRVVITEDAGTGKSVFSRALLRWLSTQEGWDAMGDGEPLLGVRWERGDRAWPEKQDSLHSGFATYRPHLAQLLAESLSTSIDRALEVVDYALQNDRIVFILDAFDQLAGDSGDRQREAFSELANEMKRSPRYRIVVTSRAKKIEELRHPEELFDPETWNFARINGFTPFQQLCYLRDLVENLTEVPTEFQDEWESRFLNFNTRAEFVGQIGEDEEQEDTETADDCLRAVFPGVYDDIQELLCVPTVLFFVRRLARDSGSFPKFRNRADLYLQATEDLFVRNLPRSAEFGEQHQPLFQEILAAAAYQMMVMDAQTYVVRHHQVRTLEPDAKRRISTPDVLRQWSRLWSGVQEIAGLTDFLIVEEKSNDFFGFKHKGMMEFYAGLHLAKNSQPDWVAETTGEVLTEGDTGLIENSADANWEWAFRFAAELLEASDDRGASLIENSQLTASFAALFAPKANSTRPTEFMFGVWQILARSQEQRPRYRSIHDNVLHFYRQQFRLILLERNETGAPSERALQAAQLLLVDDLLSYVQLARDERGRELTQRLKQLPPSDDFEAEHLTAERHKMQLELNSLKALRDNVTLNSWVTRLKPEHSAYSLCSDATKPDEFRDADDEETRACEYRSTEHLTFMLGVSPEDKYSDTYLLKNLSRNKYENPWQLVRVPAFHMASCCVTWDQYRLFGQHRVNDKEDEEPELMNEEVLRTDGDRPMTHMNWHDAFCFALWVGEDYRLPSRSGMGRSCLGGH
ncbi:Formylglycine-generating sulfatase enzyme [Thalassoglobus neptunius]|uniref:Formylglycine-generating sulfatase enzyme n=1 Tax=Thalassoglobus neptunius TaxID=1938619 RepID=A0A5C5VQF2_9PLAN|nr:NACHT domain-containing protein [Thalassoglobus neptunius]TWT40866.1 Formylglycine-generating sulfatase enzyme [Thalassoglobus neptunius]